MRQLPGAVGYVELAYAVQNNMVWAALRNQSGQYVEPSTAAITAAMEGVTTEHSASSEPAAIAVFLNIPVVS